MAHGGHYDPETDLSKLEKGFVDLVELVSEDNKRKTPANLRKELQGRYDEVIEKNPHLVADVVNKLDLQCRSDQHFKNLLEAILNDEETIALEDLNEIYYKTRMLGELMCEIEDCKRAEPYLFIALKIDQMEGKESDPYLLIDFADAVYSNIDPKGYKPAPFYDKDPKYKKVSDIKAFLEESERAGILLRPLIGEDNDNILAQEERLDVAKDILYKIIAENPRNVDALQLLAEIFMEYAGQYIKLVEEVYKKPTRNFSKADIDYVIYNFEEAQRYALQSAVYEQEDEMEDLDLSLYCSASIQFATFLAETEEIERSMNIFRNLLEKNADPIAARDSLVATMMPSIIMLKDVRNESLKDLKMYIGIRNKIQKFLDEIIYYVDYQMAEPPNSDDLLMYIAAYYNRAIILLWEGGIEEAKQGCDIIRGIGHEDACDWADDLEKHIKLQIEKERNNPSKS